MKTMLLLGTAAMLLASPALADRFSSNETASSMNHINTADPKNPIYDRPSTSTSAASGNANYKGYRPKDYGAYGYAEPTGYVNSYSSEPAYPMNDGPYYPTEGGRY
jgi:hypothetical protein